MVYYPHRRDYIKKKQRKASLFLGCRSYKNQRLTIRINRKRRFSNVDSPIHSLNPQAVTEEVHFQY